ncbi:hypothetical protein Y032_0132g1725 [Ancylostoma ceylanicum]|uniref:Uncharacterized protein n=1 Tax=Ancylostoma ceylanicum TaxID=53326 RepID=A0A016T6R6_9BILA|nr:hypothetical protein Y032_0132g1725 [Ancylostoma ceylanicum]
MRAVVFLLMFTVIIAEYVDEPVKPGKGAAIRKSYPERPQQYVPNGGGLNGKSSKGDATGIAEKYTGAGTAPLGDAPRPAKPLRPAPKPVPKPRPAPTVRNTDVRVKKTNQELKQNQIGLLQGGNTENVVNKPNTVNIGLSSAQEVNQNTEQGNAKAAPQSDAPASPYKH